MLRPLLEPTPAFVAPPLLLHARLIDDAIQIWDTAKLPPLTKIHFNAYMQQEMSFGSLDWKVESLSKSVNFLDLTINLEQDGGITTKTFVKPMNLHLYLPPTSAHPKGTPKSLVYGTLHRYWIQNSSVKDFTAVVKAFYGHLLNRGWTHDVLDPLFLEAAASIDQKLVRTSDHEEPLWDTPTNSSSGRLFIHWEYHPRDVGRRAVRQMFEETLAPALEESGLPVKQLTVAYSTPKSLGECLTKTQLEEPEGHRVSSYIGPMELPPANL